MSFWMVEPGVVHSWLSSVVVQVDGEVHLAWPCHISHDAQWTSVEGGQTTLYTWLPSVDSGHCLAERPLHTTQGQLTSPEDV